MSDGEVEVGVYWPSQSGNAGKFLTTDGIMPSWGTPAGGGGALQTATVTLTSAQIKALAGTPVIIIPTQGPGKFITLLSAIYQLKFAAPAYVDPGGAGLVGLFYGTDINLFAADALNNAFLTQTASVIEAFTYAEGITVGRNGALQTGVADTPIKLLNPGANFTTGNSSLTITAYFAVVTLQ